MANTCIVDIMFLMLRNSCIECICFSDIDIFELRSREFHPELVMLQLYERLSAVSFSDAIFVKTFWYFFFFFCRILFRYRICENLLLFWVLLFSQEESNWPGCWMLRTHFRICSTFRFYNFSSAQCENTRNTRIPVSFFYFYTKSSSGLVKW